MSEGARVPVPRVQTSGEYVASLREVRLRSGLTYREIARRAVAAGQWLPPSTLAALLGRSTLPREEAVVAFLTAVGTPPDEIQGWTEARRIIATRPDAVPGQGVELRQDVEARQGVELRQDVEARQGVELRQGGGQGVELRPADDVGEPPAADYPGPAGRVPGAAVWWSRPIRPTRRRLAVLSAFTVLLVVGLAGVLTPRLTGDDGRSGAPSNAAQECPATLRQGDQGHCVQRLQERLVARGLGLPVDSWFGPYTASRVMAFQVLTGLPVTGQVDTEVSDGLHGDSTVLTGWPVHEVNRHLRATFPEDPGGAVRLAKCLSRLDPYQITAHPDGSRRWGLFQFTDTELVQLSVDHRTALDPTWSAGAARRIWVRDGDFDHWRCTPPVA